MSEIRSSHLTVSDDVLHKPKMIWSIQKTDSRNVETSPKMNETSKISKYDVASLLMGPKNQNIIKPEVIDSKFVKKFKYDKF